MRTMVWGSRDDVAAVKIGGVLDSGLGLSRLGVFPRFVVRALDVA